MGEERFLSWKEIATDEVQERLRAIASSLLKHERDPGSLGSPNSPTALVNTALVHLKRADQDWDDVKFNSVEEFLAYCRTVMKNRIIQHKRARNALKRGGGWKQVDLASLDALERVERDDPEQNEVIHAALEELKINKPEWAQAIQLRFWVGCKAREIGELLGISEEAAQKYIQRGRAFVQDYLDRHPPRE